MAKIEFPQQLIELLENSDFYAPIRSLSDRIGEIVTDNKLPFFPDYTDHGIDHINSVLKSEVELVPKEIWTNSKKDSNPCLLCDADAAVIVGATLLHDIAMHLHPDGFRELIRKDSRFLPLPWFKENHEDHSADCFWHDLWDDYIREARRFSERELTDIIGEGSARVWKFHDLPIEIGQWEKNHFLIIGEFIRRHHARLAHEIAIYGFPGLPIGSSEGRFPAMGKEEGHPLMRLADLIGLTARSHWMSLRLCKSYLESSSLYPGTPKPMGTAIFYPMALLRVADYLQIDKQRAPAVLLQLRNPQSPISVQEWKKHRTVQFIGPATDPRGKMVTVSPDMKLSLYLQIHDLLADLQAEIDHSTAVLDEIYGNLNELGLNKLNLATRRIYSNMLSSAFRDSLPYIPNKTGFTADPNLLTLLVEPLYGKHPGVGVRELMQNAVDAVCELKVWCETKGVPIKSLDLPKQDGDVLIEFIKQRNGAWILRVRDRGIGMSGDTIQNYFLRAGASFRRSAEWAKEFLDEKGQSRVIRSGRFGIGAFAVFLLGHSFRLWTRHVTAEKSMGYTLEASTNSQLIEISRIDGLPVGTTIEIEINDESLKVFNLEKENEYYMIEEIDWFCWDWPKIVKRIIRGTKKILFHQKYSCPIHKTKLPPEWYIIRHEGFDAIFWTFDNVPPISCNGLKVGKPETYHTTNKIFWPKNIQTKAPNIAVLDRAANFPLTIQRYELSQQTVPFIDELIRDVIVSFIAHALVCGPTSQKEALSKHYGHPLQLKQFPSYRSRNDSIDDYFDHGRLRWCTTSMGMVPVDPWLYTLLNTELCLIYGMLDIQDEYSEGIPDKIGLLDKKILSTEATVLSWNGIIIKEKQYEYDVNIAGWPDKILSKLIHEGIPALDFKIKSSNIIVSTNAEYSFDTQPNSRNELHRNMKSKDEIWSEIYVPKSKRRYFEMKKGNITPFIPMKAALNSYESSFVDKKNDLPNWKRESIPDILFVSGVRTKNTKRSPESMIAKIWNECLGAKVIPFDVAERKALIMEGCKHPELKKHIEAWQEMKRTGSKWVNKA